MFKQIIMKGLKSRTSRGNFLDEAKRIGEHLHTIAGMRWCSSTQLHMIQLNDLRDILYPTLHIGS